MIRSILVPVHQSPSSGAAMKTAARLAHLVKGRLHALFVVDPYRFLYVPLTSAVGSPITGDIPLHAPLPPADLLAEEEAVEDEEKELRQTFRTICDREGLQGDFRMLRGDLNRTIVRCSRSVDLILMGSRTEGSHSLVEDVLRESARPLMVVPTDGRTTGPVLFAYDGSAASQRAMAMGASLLASGAHPSAHVLTVGKPAASRDHLWDARQYLSAYVTDVTTHEAEGDVATNVQRVADDIGAGLVVLGTHGHSALRSVLFGSTTTQVLERAGEAVLFVG